MIVRNEKLEFVECASAIRGNPKLSWHAEALEDHYENNYDDLDGGCALHMEVVIVNC